jgi:hypothetical protein
MAGNSINLAKIANNWKIFSQIKEKHLIMLQNVVKYIITRTFIRPDENGKPSERERRKAMDLQPGKWV